jgi:hypothetical protein
VRKLALARERNCLKRNSPLFCGEVVNFPQIIDNERVERFMPSVRSPRQAVGQGNTGTLEIRKGQGDSSIQERHRKFALMWAPPSNLLVRGVGCDESQRRNKSFHTDTKLVKELRGVRSRSSGSSASGKNASRLRMCRWLTSWLTPAQAAGRTGAYRSGG